MLVARMLMVECWWRMLVVWMTVRYVLSITILGGPFNVLHEDYHVVHHQYPGR
jgi:hypothetical protein